MAGADIVMLDNFTPEQLAPAALELKSKFPTLAVEASGGINMDTISSYALPGVDIISMGMLTQGYSTVDISMKLPRPSSMAAGPSPTAE